MPGIDLLTTNDRWVNLIFRSRYNIRRGKRRMKIYASLNNSAGNHQFSLKMNNNTHSIAISPKESGFGSTTNGGELLFLALATCYCNDIYREASKLAIEVTQVEVEVMGDFDTEGGPAKNVTYKAKVTAKANEAEIHNLMINTDKVAEIQNTLRVETPIKLKSVEAVTIV